MPTPRHHGGAAVQNIPLVRPAFRGLNLQAAASILSPEWATTLTNTVIDDTGRIAARKGWSLTNTPVAEDIKQVFTYKRESGSETIISSGQDVIYSGYTGSLTDITNTVPANAGNWQFVNFHDLVVGFQDNETPIVWDGVAAGFAPIVASGGTLPTGNAGLAAFGRLWGVDNDGQTIRYTVLLDETDWTVGAGLGGTIDMATVWPHGTDTVVGLAEHNRRLIVFGKRQIVIWDDPQGTSLGLDPDSLQVVDTFNNVGLAARDSLQNVNGDLWWLSDNGLQSLGRLIQERSAPSRGICPQVRDLLAQLAAGVTDVKSVVSFLDRFYLLSFVDEGITFCFDTRGYLEDGSVICSGQWQISYGGMSELTATGRIVVAPTAETGSLGTYSGYLDNLEEYSFIYESGWLDLGTDLGAYTKIPKRYSGIFYSASDNSITFRWSYDFNETRYQRTLSSTGGGALSEWGIAEWGADDPPVSGGQLGDPQGEWGGGATLSRKKVTMNKTAQYIRIGIETPINGGAFAVQQVDLLAKIGRMI